MNKTSRKTWLCQSEYACKPLQFWQMIAQKQIDATFKKYKDD